MDEILPVWEQVGSANSGFTTFRMKVTGGWMVMVRDSSNSSSHVNFVVDPQWRWVIAT